MRINKFEDFWAYIILFAPLILLFFIKWYWLFLIYNIIFLWLTFSAWRDNKTKNIGLAQVILFPLLFNFIGLLYIILKMDSTVGPTKEEEIKNNNTNDCAAVSINEKGELEIFREFLMIYSIDVSFEDLPLEMQNAKNDYDYLENIPAPYKGDDYKKNSNIYKTLSKHIVFSYDLPEEIKRLVDVQNLNVTTDTVEMDWPSESNLPVLSVAFTLTFKILSQTKELEGLIKNVHLNMGINWKDNSASSVKTGDENRKNSS